ncbi:transposase [Prosthecochloris sp. SCSIO W1101]|uniref:transposase n=1 Tax=Prosthecochloris sp. SCSIO W1101 TaxID=2992242 RepID=UPI0039FBC848
MSKSLVVEESLKALRMALRSIKQPKGMIHHSDRGIQYCSKAYSGLLRNRGVSISMTEEDHVYENANAERLNGILKQELGLGGVIRSFKVAKKLVREAVDLYNNKRLHLALNYRTPAEVHAA